MQKGVRVINWDQVPLILRAADLRMLGLSRHAAYELGHILGKRLGNRLIIPKEALRRWLEENGQRDNLKQ